jgi:hypothetical protein
MDATNLFPQGSQSPNIWHNHFNAKGLLKTHPYIHNQSLPLADVHIQIHAYLARPSKG